VLRFAENDGTVLAAPPADAPPAGPAGSDRDDDEREPGGAGLR
jgi:hypothetical protein